MTERYCGSSMAFRFCKCAGPELPICAASEVLHYACEYRHKGFGKPAIVEPVIAHGDVKIDEPR